MKSLRSTKQRSAIRTSGMEIMGAMSVATQMAFLCPPGFDEMLRRELKGESMTGRHNAHQSHRHAR
ncbi:MAG: hypothetical protein WBM00_08830 [Solirubrobacterales bacterium]